MKESDIMRDVQLAASEMGGRLFRNNVGVFKTIDGRVIRGGLAPGSSDLIGFTPALLGDCIVAVFTAVEVKSKTGKPTKDQKRFINAVNKAGGIAGIVRSRHDYEFLIETSLQNIGLLSINS